jgi:hypothetical protein
MACFTDSAAATLNQNASRRASFEGTYFPCCFAARFFCTRLSASRTSSSKVAVLRLGLQAAPGSQQHRAGPVVTGRK